MPDLTKIETRKEFLTEDSNEIKFTATERFYEDLWVQVEITQRDENTGTYKKDLPIPRLWTGYFYVMNEECVVEFGTIQFQNQEIFRAKNFSYKAEIANQENSNNLTTIDLDVDNIDEIAESIFWLNNTDKSQYYLPSQLPYEGIIFAIPKMCRLKVLIHGLKFSKQTSGAGGILETDLYKDLNGDGIPDNLTVLPSSSERLAKINANRIISSQPLICAANGYVPLDGLGTSLASGSGISGQEILDMLLAQGKISQQDIDSIKNAAPDFTPEQILDALLALGIISQQDLAAALAAAANDPLEALANASGQDLMKNLFPKLEGQPFKRHFYDHIKANPYSRSTVSLVSISIPSFSKLKWKQNGLWRFALWSPVYASSFGVASQETNLISPKKIYFSPFSTGTPEFFAMAISQNSGTSSELAVDLRMEGESATYLYSE